MKFLFIQKYIFLLLLVVIVIVSVGLGYLLAAGNAFLQQPDIVTPTANLTFTPPAELTQFRPQKPCSSKPRNFQAGMPFHNGGQQPTATAQMPFTMPGSQPVPRRQIRRNRQPPAVQLWQTSFPTSISSAASSGDGTTWEHLI